MLSLFRCHFRMLFATLMPLFFHGVDIAAIDADISLRRRRCFSLRLRFRRYVRRCHLLAFSPLSPSAFTMLPMLLTALSLLRHY